MRKINVSLDRALGNEDVLKAARAYKAMRRWREVVGPFLAERSMPDRYTKGTVWVAVQGSSWAQELRMMKDRILSRLRDIAGEPELFQDVRFGVRPLPPAPEEATPAPDEAPTDGMSIQEIARRRLRNWPGDA